MPEDSKYGVWPRSGEIDIAEARGNSYDYSLGGRDVYTTALHWGNPNNPNTTFPKLNEEQVHPPKRMHIGEQQPVKQFDGLTTPKTSIPMAWNGLKTICSSTSTLAWFKSSLSSSTSARTCGNGESSRRCPTARTRAC